MAATGPWIQEPLAFASPQAWPGSKDQIANICWIIKKAREFQKNIYFIDYAKAFDYVDHCVISGHCFMDSLHWPDILCISSRFNSGFSPQPVPHPLS